MTHQQTYSLKQTAKVFGLSMPTIYRLIAKGELKTFRVASVQRVTESEILRIQNGQ